MELQRKLENNLEAILVFTKDQELKGNLVKIFINEPYEIEFCNKHSSILKTIHHHSTTVFIFDVSHYSEKDLEIIPTIIRMKKEIHLIFISEVNPEDTFARIKQHRQAYCFKHVYYYLQKPVKSKELLVAVHSAIEFNHQWLQAHI